MLCALAVCATDGLAKDIVHDAEYYVAAKQNGEKWAAEDKIVDEKLTAFREKNGGKSCHAWLFDCDPSLHCKSKCLYSLS